ncbi:BLUF domain-containing protein [Vibrio ostreicida]|uniref:BLUF domain-containing protein n=1 Tax=Vibrio ostreicida TaxID=526588 RepID=A0ABT8BZ49_9VIBR|nr:BLUF domain-containing protein [Vibrio ostreicida]MDN3611953.1 BLUF domain-containing protein [Vibrio ostreicida]NPD08867.1 BLUF domain-containing protein [Vibrio ostreicida]
MEMIELIYVSKATNRFNQEQLEALLSTARKNNTSSDITGLLLYDGYGTFIQVLEGPEDQVEALFNKIKKDSRHGNVNRIGFHRISGRSFSEWKMGFKVLDQHSGSSVTGYSDFLAHREDPDYLVNNQSFALRMVKHFAQSTERG